MVTTRDEARRLSIREALGALPVGLAGGFFTGDCVHALATCLAMVYMFEAHGSLTNHFLRPRDNDGRAIWGGTRGTPTWPPILLGGTT